VIPDAAVEAAAETLWEPNERDDEWVGEFDTYKAYLHAQARKVLEAAAPHMQGAAGNVHPASAEAREAISTAFMQRYYPNPYRSQA